jgi:membrane fusion protein, multidrug efflux system
MTAKISFFTFFVDTLLTCFSPSQESFMKRFFPYTVLFLAACNAGDKPSAPPAAAGAAPPPVEVETLIVTRSTAQLTQDLPGRLQAFRTAQVRAQVEGLVQKRLFAEGSDVAAGSALYQIDARNYQTAFDAAKSDLALAKLNVARYQPLLGMHAASQQEFDLAEVKLKQAEAAYSRAQENLQNARVPAPIAGHIGRSLVTEGALVGHGEATQLATIEQIDPIYANFTQSGAELQRLRSAIKAGKLQHHASTQVQLVLEDGSIYALAGQLQFADLAVDPSTGSVSMRASFPNPQHELLPGSFVTVRLPQADMSDAIRVPQRAVQTSPQGQMVLLVGADNKVMPQPVKTSSMAGGDFVISDGLKGGEQVIVNGVQKARPGSVVKPVALSGVAAAEAKK